MFCCCHFNNSKIENSNLIPSGVGQKENFPSNWMLDRTGDNISKKNKDFAELTFHYWLWKNNLDNLDQNDWIGLCQYRRFWLKKDHEKEVNFKNLFENILTKIPPEAEKYESILTSPENINLKFKSVLKYRKLINNLKNPLPIFIKKNQTIDVQFEVYTKSGNLIYEVANLMKKEDKYDFLNFISSNNKINLHNMFIVKKNTYYHYSKEMFEWLFKCDEYIKKKKKYQNSMPRIQAFLAERFLPFWFRKYTNFKEWPWVFCDTSKF